jgi:hypothetical protein
VRGQGDIRESTVVDAACDKTRHAPAIRQTRPSCLPLHLPYTVQIIYNEALPGAASRPPDASLMSQVKAGAVAFYGWPGGLGAEKISAGCRAPGSQKDRAETQIRLLQRGGSKLLQIRHMFAADVNTRFVVKNVMFACAEVSGRSDCKT